MTQVVWVWGVASPYVLTMGNWDRGTVLIWGACAVLVLGLGGRWILGQTGGPGEVGSSSSHPNGASSAATSSSGPMQGEGAGAEQVPGQVIVHVVGSVRRPGVYRLAAGSRVYQAVRAAGGSTPQGDQDAVDLAARAVDGSQIVIPRRGAAPVGGGSSGGVVPGAERGPISLSTAKPEDLDRLDGIGPALAARIIQWRDAHGGFKSVTDLDQVSGIGPAKLASLRPQVVP